MLTNQFLPINGKMRIQGGVRVGDICSSGKGEGKAGKKIRSEISDLYVFMLKLAHFLKNNKIK